MANGYYLYILLCADETLYTGITNNLTRRLKQHNAGKASKYTRSRRPVYMIYKEFVGSRSNALRRELSVKSKSRTEKILMIEADFDKVRELVRARRDLKLTIEHLTDGVTLFRYVSPKGDKMMFPKEAFNIPEGCRSLSREIAELLDKRYVALGESLLSYGVSLDDG